MAKKRHLVWTAVALAHIAGGMSTVLAEEHTHTISKAEAELLKAEGNRVDAMVRADEAALNRAVGDELIFGHGNGGLQNKTEFVKAFAHGSMHFRSIELSEQSARVYGNVGITHGRQTLHLGNDAVLSDRYMGAYLKRDGRWQLVGWQSTPIPDSNRPQGAAAAPQAK